MGKHLSFNGFTANIDKPKDFTEEFDDVYNDTYATLISKKRFSHIDETYSFDYRYGIKVYDIEEKGETIQISLELFVDEDSLSRKQKEAITRCMESCDNESILEYGLGVTIGIEEVPSEPGDLLRIPKVKYVLDSIANLLGTIDALRAFKLDQYANRIGQTGWDLILDCI